MYERYEPFMSYVRLSRPASDADSAAYTVADVRAAADEMSEAHPEVTFAFPGKNERGLFSCFVTLDDGLDPEHDADARVPPGQDPHGRMA